VFDGDREPPPRRRHQQGLPLDRRSRTCTRVPREIVRGGCFATPRDPSAVLRVYAQLGVLFCPFELGEGEKLPVQVNSVTPPWLIVRV
jgi:hypothetical protein